MFHHQNMDTTCCARCSPLINEVMDTSSCPTSSKCTWWWVNSDVACTPYNYSPVGNPGHSASPTLVGDLTTKITGHLCPRSSAKMQPLQSVNGTVVQTSCTRSPLPHSAVQKQHSDSDPWSSAWKDILVEPSKCKEVQSWDINGALMH